MSRSPLVHVYDLAFIRGILNEASSESECALYRRAGTDLSFNIILLVPAPSFAGYLAYVTRFFAQLAPFLGKRSPD
jgi:hypothetical protein